MNERWQCSHCEAWFDKGFVDNPMERRTSVALASVPFLPCFICAPEPGHGYWEVGDY